MDAVIPPPPRAPYMNMAAGGAPSERAPAPPPPARLPSPSSVSFSPSASASLPRPNFDGYDIPRDTVNPKVMKSPSLDHFKQPLQKSLSRTSKSSAPRSPTIIVSPPDDGPGTHAVFTFPRETSPGWTRTSLLLVLGISVSLAVSIIFVVLLFVIRS